MALSVTAALLCKDSTSSSGSTACRVLVRMVLLTMSRCAVVTCAARGDRRVRYAKRVNVAHLKQRSGWSLCVCSMFHV